MSRESRPTTPVLGEALANLRARAWFTGTMIMAFASLICLVTVTEHNAIVTARNFDRRLALTGHHTLLVEADAGSPVTAALLTAERCAALRQIPGARAVVWLGAQETLTVWSTNAQLIPARRVDGDVDQFFLDLARPVGFTLTDATVLLDDSSIVARPHHGPFNLVVVDRFGSRVTLRAATIPLTALGAGLGGSSLRREHLGGTVAGCAVDVSPHARELVERSVRLAVPLSSGTAISWASPMADDVSSLVDQRSSLSRHHWLAATWVGIVIGILYRRIRGRDLALYALWGLQRRQLFRVALSEFALILAAAIAVAAVCITTAAVDGGVPLVDLRAGSAAAVRMCLALGGALSALTWRWARRAYREVVATLNDS